MKSMFKMGLMTAVAVGTFAAASAFAQEKGGDKPAPQGHGKMMRGGNGPMGGAPMMGGRGGPGMMMGMMAKELNLTDDQKAKIKAIMDGVKDKVGDAMKSREGLQKKYEDAIAAGDEATAKAAVEAIAKDMADHAATRIEIKKQIEAVLTPEQVAKSEELRKAQKAKMEEMRAKMRERMQERMSGKDAGKTPAGEGCCPPPPPAGNPPPPPPPAE